ncbi:Ig-like domain-containing protein [uncultured Draconibacterium sp.]|uniref:Ig-like domain-containing protein n=1 Tax=uncultured Draconibacterium sp. TaxID=1573823 RepID=UPI0032180444
MKRQKYILMMMMMVVTTMVAAQESYVIDSVCLGAYRTYRLDGEEGSTYEWNIYRTSDSSLYAADIPYIEFVDPERPAPGDTTWGSEIDQLWDEEGEFDVEVLHWSAHGCDTVEIGRIKVYPIPEAEAGPDQTVCSMEDIILDVDTAWNHSSLLWTSTGDGTFSDSTALHPTYLLGPGDSLSGSVQLIITAYGLADNITCEPAIDTVEYFFSNPDIAFSVEDILCFGDSSASIIADVTNGIAPYTFNWTGPSGFTASTDTITNLAAGWYYLEVIDDNGCPDVDSVEIISPPEILVSIDSTQNISCYGASDGLIWASGTGGTGTLTFDWVSYSGYTISGDTLYGLPADTFLLTVSDDNLCSVIDTVILTEPEPLIVDIDSVIDILCYGDSSGAAHVVVMGGTEPYIIEWNTLPVQDSAWARNLLPGEYVVTVTDANNCSATDTVIINEPLELLVNIDSVHNISCYGGNDGFILASASGGTGALTFEWTGYSTGTYFGDSVYNMPADTFLLTVTDENNCFVNDTVIIIEPEPLYALVDSIIDVQCYEYDNGAAHVIVDGGTAPFTYQWDNNPALDSAWVIDLAPGQHTVIVTDANNCMAYDTLTIIEPAPLVLISDSLDVRCGGKKPGAIDLEVSGGTPFIDALGQPYYLYEWSDSTGNVFASTQDLDSLAGDQLYTVWVEDSLGCREIHQVYINEVKNMLLEAVVDSAYCYGDLWSIDLTVSRGRKPYTYMWTDSAGTVISTDEDLSNIGPGTYWITVNDKDSCDESLQFVFDPLEELLVDISADDTITCENSVILVSGNPIGGTGELTHIWTGNGAAYLNRTDTADVIFSGATAGNYRLIYTVFDANACVASDSIDLIIQPPLEDTIYASICANELPYNWLGTDYFGAGQYHDTILGEIGVGCDTIRMLDLYIEPMEEDTIYASICANELPYNWLGTDYFGAGQYIDTIPGEVGVGCDTIRMLDLFIEPMEEDTIYASICANELPYNWLGTDYFGAGQYIDTIPGEVGVGCDTIRMLDLFIEPMEEDTIYASICANELPYNWNGTDYYIAGEYIDTIPGEVGVGCDTIRMLDLFIEPMEEDTIYVSLCANELPYNWNGTDYYLAGEYIDTIPGEIGVGCDTIRMLDLFIEPMEEDTIYASICSNELPYNWLGTDYFGAGQYIDTIPGEIGVGCDTIRMLDLFIEPMEEDTIYASICSNELPYNWNGTDYFGAGQYIDTIPGEVGVGCDTIRMLDLFIEPMEEDTIYASICSNELPYNWNGTDYFGAGQYIDTIPGEIGVGCDTIRMLDLFIEPMEEDTIYTSICANELPYNWNGTDYYLAGEYIDTIPGEIGVGCDTIRMLDLFIEPMEEDTIYVSLCANELPYNWNGTDYYLAGEYIDTIAGEIGVGCDTIRMLDLFIEPMEEDTIYVSLCANELPYNWLGTDYFGAGQYIDTIPGEVGVGCDTIRMLDLFIEPMEEDTIYASICANELPYNWNGTDYYLAGEYIDTIPGEIGVGCDTIRMLDLFIEPMEEDTIYASICANELPYNWNGTDYYIAGEYIDTIPGEVGVGCDTIRMLDLFIEPMEEDTIYASICANELPYNWLGTDYFGAGQYIDTIPGEIGVGCDTIRMLDLFIEPMEEDTIYVSLCANELPYNWLGTDYFGAGQYIDTIPGEIGVGCDTIRMLDLFIEPMEEDTIYTSICANELPYNWNGTDYYLAGEYIDTIPGEIGVGCDTIRMLDLFIEPMEEDTIYVSLCANELPYNWNGTDYYLAGEYIDTIPGEIGVGCDTIRMLDLFIEPMEEDTIYASICANELPYNWLGTDYFGAGQYIDTIPGEIGVGCDTIRMLDLFIEPMEEDTIYASICANELPYNWNGTDYFGAGQYIDTLAGEIGVGCDTIRMLDLFIEPMEEDTIYASICANELPYNWNGTDYFGAGQYIDTIPGEIGVGCDTIRMLDLFIEPMEEDTIYASICANELPYNWNGTDYFGAGQYIDTIPGEIGVGCDTIRMLDLFIEPMEEDTIYASICANELPYNWNGTDYFGAGQYIDTLAGEIGVGCDTIRMLDLFIEPMEEDTIYASICANELPYNWKGTDYFGAGQYIDTIPGEIGVGCDTIRMLDLFIEPMEEDTIYASICANELPYNWLGTDYFGAGQYIDTIPGEIGVGCDTIRMLDLFIEPMEEDTIYASICANELPYNWNGTDYFGAGQYIDTIPGEIGVGCDTIITLDLFIEPMEEDTIFISLCTNELPYDWNGNPITAAGQYLDTIPGVIGVGCDTLMSLFVEVHEPDTIIMDTTLCQGAPVFAWNTHMVLTDADSTYEATLVNIYGCDSLLTLNVYIIPPIYTSEEMTLCLGDAAVPWNGYTIVSTNDSTYVATLKNSEGCDSVVTMDVTILYPTSSEESIEVCENDASFDWNGNAILTDRDDVYYATLTNAAGCDSLLTLNVKSNPVSSYEMDTTLCVGALSFIWNGLTINTDADDIYNVTLVNAFNCDSLVTLNVYVVPPDTINVDTAICEGEPVFVWEGLDIFSDVDRTYEARYMNQYGCDSLVNLNVTIIPKTDTVIDTMLCYGTPSFPWNTLEIYALNDSTYLDTLTNAAGCDSLLTLNVSIIYPDTVNIDTTICEGEPVFAWGVNSVHQVDSYTDSIYTDVLQNQYGCDSIVNLEVEILRPIDSLLTVDLCASDSFLWDDTWYAGDRDSMYFDTLYYAAGCDSLRLQLEIISHPLYDTTMFMSLCEGSAPIVWEGHTLNTFADGTYSTTWPTKLWACDSTLTLVVEIVPAIKDTIPYPVCYGEAVADWYGQVISSEVDSMYIHNLPEPSGCDTLLYLDVKVLPVTDSTLYLTLCAGGPDTTLNKVLITSLQSWIYFDTIPNTYGCDSLLTYDVTVIPPDTTLHYDTLCVGDPEYIWNGYTVSTSVEDVYVANVSTEQGCDSVAILTTTLINGGVTYDTVYACVEYTWIEGTGDTYYTSDDYLFTLGDGTACPDTTWLHLVISDPVIDADPVDVLCYGDSTGSIDIEVSGGVEPYSYLWSNGETTQDISDLPAGTYTVTVTDALSDTLYCDATMDIVITEPTPIAITEDLITNVEVMGESTGSIEVTVNEGTPGYDYAWTNEAGDTVGINEDLYNQPAGDYTLTVTDANDCEATYTGTITEPVPLDRYMSCVQIDALTCFEDLDNYPIAYTLSEYLALDTSVQVYSHNCGLDTLTFNVFDSIVSSSVYCYEEIRIYSIDDSCGNTLSCTQIIVVNDTERPTMACPPKIVVTNDVVPAAYADTTEFLAAGGFIDDNCGVVSFRQVGSDVSDGGSEPEILTRTYEITDYCGNVQTCTQIIEVYLTAEFSIECVGLPNIAYECKADLPVYKNIGEFRADGGYAYSSPFAIDSFWVVDVSNGSKCPETVTRTYYIRNTIGEIDNCKQTFVIDDKTPPVFILPDKYISCTDPLNSVRIYRTGREVQLYSGSAGNRGDVSDNCTDMRTETVYFLNQTKLPGSCPTIYERKYRIFDACDNPAEATERIIVEDIPLEVVSLPKTLTEECYLPEPYNSIAAFEADGGKVNVYCGATLDFAFIQDVNGGASEPGVVYRTYRFWDTCDSIDVVQKIIIRDEIPPTIGIPDLVLDCVPVDIATLEVFISYGGWFADNCEIDSSSFNLFYTDTIGDVCPRVYVNRFEIFDMSGNRGTTEQRITVIDSIQPLLTCPPDDTIDATEAFPVPFALLDGFISAGGTTSDNCALDSASFTLLSADSVINDCESQITYTYTIADNCGNWSEPCSYTIYKRDFSDPVLTCPNDIVVECFDDVNTQVFTSLAQFISAGGNATDNYALLESSFTHTGDSLIGTTCPMVIVRSYSIEDICGNTAECSYRITVNDVTPPVITCPADTAIECLSEIISDITTIEEFEAAGGKLFDNCEIDPNSFTARTEKVFDLDRKTIVNYFSISDLCGNTDSCVQVITLTDTIPPEAVCNSITVYLDETGNYVLTDIDMQTISKGSNDNCTAEEDLIIEVDIVDFTCEDVEEGKLVNVVVTDEAGNSTVCMADITVVDNLPPTAICQDITVYLDETGIATITAQMIDNGSYDNCKLEAIYISRDRFDCTDVGANLVKLYAVDAYGLRDTCEAIVTVIDETPPSIICIGNQTVQLDQNGLFDITWEMVTDSVWDECGIDTVLLDDYQLDCDNIGTTIITATAYDVNGNASTCQIEYEVFGNIAPNVVNDSAVTAVDIPVDINVVNNDYDLKTSINYASLGVIIHPSHGSVTVDNKTGIVTYTPDPGYIGPDIFRYTICDDGIPCVPMCGEAIVFITVRPANQPPVAIDDYFDVPCGNLTGNVLVDNGGGADSDPDGDEIVVNPIPITGTTSGVIILYDNGNFEYEPFEDFVGVDSFQYEIHDVGVPPTLYDTAWVYITRVADNDCDGVADVDDIDDDNDGIRDVNEGDLAYDSDLDGIPDSYDVDSDNDGILDNIEGQGEHNYIPPTGRDTDGDGWDDAYDPDNGGYPFDISLTDTDGDSMPDFLDIDSDNDGVFDFIEGHDENADGIADVVRIYSDSDFDGLDDAYDTQSGWAMPGNETASNAPLQDFDGDGERDWRDTNDEDDAYQTINEDINGNGDFSDDDLDLDGHPEYLDTEIDCELFIPEGFSPNDDGVHDFFQILCIYPRYPNAKMMIFNRNGQLLFAKENYGNYDVWGWNDAWWWGTSENKLTIGRSGGLPAGNYIYVLELNDGLGTVKNGTVMLAY